LVIDYHFGIYLQSAGRHLILIIFNDRILKLCSLITRFPNQPNWLFAVLCGLKIIAQLESS